MIGLVIKQIRKEKRMRQSEVALVANFKQPNLSRIESGKVSPSIKTQEKLALALGCHVDDFYDKERTERATGGCQLSYSTIKAVICPECAAKLETAREMFSKKS